jgi:hypothetical protein
MIWLYYLILSYIDLHFSQSVTKINTKTCIIVIFILRKIKRIGILFNFHFGITSVQVERELLLSHFVMYCTLHSNIGDRWALNRITKRQNFAQLSCCSLSFVKLYSLFFFNLCFPFSDNTIRNIKVSNDDFCAVEKCIQANDI